MGILSGESDKDISSLKFRVIKPRPTGYGGVSQDGYPLGALNTKHGHRGLNYIDLLHEEEQRLIFEISTDEEIKRALNPKFPREAIVRKELKNKLGWKALKIIEVMNDTTEKEREELIKDLTEKEREELRKALTEKEKEEIEKLKQTIAKEQEEQWRERYRDFQRKMLAKFKGDWKDLLEEQKM